MTIARKDFDQVAKEEFRFLEVEFDFELTRCVKNIWGYELVYINQTTGVKLDYEFRHAYIFIMLYQLEDGQFKENPPNVNSETVLYGYALDDLIILRNSKALIKPAYQYGEDSKYYDQGLGLTNYVKEFSENLKKYAPEILKGDFQVFKDLDKIVRERIRNHNMPY